jgi:DNA polymerase-4
MSADEGIRKIIHVDMDAFFASVEQRDFPELKGKPLVVGGSPDGRGVVASASYEARAFGVRSAMSALRARKLCPGVLFVPPRFEAYQAASKKILELFHEATDLVEPLSLDEAYLDVTQNKWNEALAGKIAIRLLRNIEQETGLTASAGVSNTLFVAKLASGFKKPRGLTIVTPEEVMDFIAPLPVSQLWGVGPATEKVLHELGLFKIQDLRTFPLDALERELGKQGRFLQRLALGQDQRRVEPGWERKSYGGETTFQKDLLRLESLRDSLEVIANDLADALRRDQRRAKTISLKLRYSDFETISRNRTLMRYTDDPGKILSVALELLQDRTEAGLKPVRLIGISLSQLLGANDPEQLWLELSEFD